MGRYILRRLILLVPTIFGISVLVFALMRFLPGDVVDGLMGAEGSFTPEQRETLVRLLGLDRPLHRQYLEWLGALIRLDLGSSFRSSEPVLTLIVQRVGVTVELALLSILFSTAIAVPLGILAAVRRNGVIAWVAQVVGLLGLSLPSFWLALLLLLVASLQFQWYPSLLWMSPFEDPVANLEQMLLPVLSLSGALIAVVMRMTRSAMLEVLGQDYVRTARAKGLRERVVIYRHGFRNALIPIITVIGLQLGHLLGGTVVIEQIFGLPGIGWLILNGINQRDYPVVQGGVLFVALSFVLINILVDVLYAASDPRIRYS
ncbi:MAG: ABC transporter permease [Thermomicrobiales bacterium]